MDRQETGCQGLQQLQEQQQGNVAWKHSPWLGAQEDMHVYAADQRGKSGLAPYTVRNSRLRAPGVSKPLSARALVSKQTPSPQRC
jgi:hypothetical protein